MVKAVDVEGLIKRYLDENSLERADALYLLVSLGREDATKALTARYGVSGALSSVLEDLKALGVGHTSVRMEDTDEFLEDTVRRSFESLCLRKILEHARLKAEGLSRTAKQILYIVSLFPHETLSIDDIQKFYYVTFQEKIERPMVEKALRELVSGYVVQEFSYSSIRFPQYIDDILNELREFMPEVEVIVSWPETKR